MKIKIRQLGLNDKKAFVELSLALTKFNKKQHDKYYKNLKYLLEVKRKRVEETFNNIKKTPSKKVFMAFLDDKPVGYIRAFTYDSKLKQGCIDELYIKKEARGLGIGKKLMDSVMKWMIKKEVKRMIVSVYSWNSPARKFYEEEGFLEYALSYEKIIGAKE